MIRDCMSLILYTKRVNKNFGGIKACNSINLDVEKGKITALIGPNGAGKTTLFEIISGLQTLDSGNIHFKRKNITKERPYKIANLGIARTFQQVRLFKNLSLEKHIEFALDNDDVKFFKNVFSDTSVVHWNVKSALDKVGLDKHTNTLAHNLSYGQRKLLDLAIALAKPHELLMLDEPVAGVTPKLREQIKRILTAEKTSGKTVLLIEHDMGFVMEIADIVYVLAQGKIIAQGKPKDIMKNPKVLEAYLGE
jgi:branched-chain amino acid transport system ATP-binding protein